MRRTPALLAAAAAATLAAVLPASSGSARTAPAQPGQATAAVAPKLLGFQAFTADRRPFAGDGRLVTTVSPNGDRVRRAARIRVLLTGSARVTFRVTRTDGAPQVLHEASATLARGWHVFTWVPSPKVTPRTYLTRFEVVDAAGNRRLYGPRDARTGRVPTTPVIRVLGVDAGFTRESYVEGETALLRVETDARSLQLQVFHAGHEGVPTYDNTVMNGAPAGEPVTIDWSRSGDGPRTVSVPVGAWPSGLYFAKLVADDGRVGYAPFVAAARDARSHGPCRGRDADEHVAGVQLPRREGQRLRRHVVREGRAEHGAAGPCFPAPRSAAAVPEVRPRLPALARDARARRSRCSPRATSRRSPRPTC